MGVPSLTDYLSLLDQLQDTQNCKVGPVLYNEFSRYTKLITDTEQQKKYSEPMPWIGMYIALASIFCILAMAADLLHGLRSRKLWFPCKYFTLDAASLSLIAVAIKLPMDLNNSMRGDVDQAAKLGSMAFMCTMMANLLPSLPTVDNKELVTNVIALVVLVITLVVNVCLQIKTGVVSIPTDTRVEIFTSLFVKEKQLGKDYRKPPSIIGYIGDVRFIAISYVVMLLALMIIYICSALTIPSCKQILERNYKILHEMSSREGISRSRQTNLSKLRKFVRRYWVMAETSSRQLMAVCSLTTTASGLICALTTILHIFTTLHNLKMLFHPDSDYDWSIPVIFITQFIGVIFGIIAPLSRCFAKLSLSFKILNTWIIWEHVNVFKIEIFWTLKLYDWQQSRKPLPIRGRKCKVVLENLKFLILGICIGIQKTVVMVCKLMALISFFFMACVIFCSKSWKLLKVKFSASGTVLVTEHQKQQPRDEEYCEYHQYVLQLQRDLGSITQMTSICNSMDRLIKKAENQTPKNLMNLLKKSGRFQGVEEYDSHQVQTLLLREYPNCWSLPLVTLTAIAISLPNIEHKKVGSLVSSVGEGMFYVTLVEESLNTTNKDVEIQKAAKMLWLQVDVYHKWLGNKLNDPTRKLKTTRQILEWFRDTAHNESSTDPNTFFKSICGASMYHIIQTLADTSCFPTNKGEMLDQEELFVRLSSMISGILAVCLINLPQVIIRRCYTSEIEKMEASVYAAAQLLGETTQIINRFEDQELPSLDPPDESVQHPFP